MEKISGILPAGRRFRNVDTSVSQPVRPGAPSFGRTVGRISNAETISKLSSAAEVEPIDKVSFSGNAKVLANEEVSIKEGFETVKKAPVRSDNEAPTYVGAKSVKSNEVEALTKRFFAPQKNDSIDRISEGDQTASSPLKNSGTIETEI